MEIYILGGTLKNDRSNSFVIFGFKRGGGGEKKRKNRKNKERKIRKIC